MNINRESTQIVETEHEGQDLATQPWWSINTVYVRVINKHKHTINTSLLEYISGYAVKYWTMFLCRHVGKIEKHCCRRWYFWNHTCFGTVVKGMQPRQKWNTPPFKYWSHSSFIWRTYFTQRELHFSIRLLLVHYHNIT